MKAKFKNKKKKFKPVTLELTFESEKEMKALYHALCLYSCDVLDALDDNCVSLVTGRTLWVSDDLECPKLPSLINIYQLLEEMDVKHNQ